MGRDRRGLSTEEIGKVIDDAMEAIKEENPKLKGVLPKNYASPDLDKDKLSDVVDFFTDEIHAENLAKSKDLLGCTYEYCNGRKGKEKAGHKIMQPACFFIACGYMLWLDQSRL